MRSSAGSSSTRTRVAVGRRPPGLRGPIRRPHRGCRRWHPPARGRAPAGRGARADGCCEVGLPRQREPRAAHPADADHALRRSTPSPTSRSRLAPEQRGADRGRPRQRRPPRGARRPAPRRVPSRRGGRRGPPGGDGRDGPAPRPGVVVPAGHRARGAALHPPLRQPPGGRPHRPGDARAGRAQPAHQRPALHLRGLRPAPPPAGGIGLRGRRRGHGSRDPRGVPGHDLRALRAAPGAPRRPPSRRRRHRAVARAPAHGADGWSDLGPVRGGAGQPFTVLLPYGSPDPDAAPQERSISAGPAEAMVRDALRWVDARRRAADPDGVPTDVPRPVPAPRRGRSRPAVLPDRTAGRGLRRAGGRRRRGRSRGRRRVAGGPRPRRRDDAEARRAGAGARPAVGARHERGPRRAALGPGGSGGERLRPRARGPTTTSPSPSTPPTSRPGSPRTSPAPGRGRATEPGDASSCRRCATPSSSSTTRARSSSSTRRSPAPSAGTCPTARSASPTPGGSSRARTPRRRHRPTRAFEALQSGERVFDESRRFRRRDGSDRLGLGGRGHGPRVLGQPRAHPRRGPRRDPCSRGRRPAHARGPGRRRAHRCGGLRAGAERGRGGLEHPLRGRRHRPLRRRAPRRHPHARRSGPARRARPGAA